MSKKSNDLKFSTELDLKQRFLAELILMDDIFMRVVLKDVKCQPKTSTLSFRTYRYEYFKKRKIF